MWTKLLIPVFLVTTSSLLLCAPDPGDKDGGSAGAAPSAKDVEHSIRSKGTKAALAELTADEARWDELTDEMAKGSEQWLRILRDLYKVADGAAAMDLGIAASEALGTAPKTVFEILEPSMGLDLLCNNDSSVGTNLAGALRLIDARRTAVRAIHDDTMGKKRDKCLALLDELESSMRASKERGDIQ
jgi:hypothetical protein